MGHDPTIDEQRAFYDSWNTQCRDAEFDGINDEIRLRAAAALDLIPPLGLEQPTVLEIGCGTGWCTERLAGLGPVTAIDLSPAAIDIARTRVPTATFLAADFFEEPFAVEHFDLVVCIETLFYVTDQSRFLDKVANLLRDKGYLLVTTINAFAYGRSSDIGPPAAGQVRQWLSIRHTRALLARHFDILTLRTVEPRGDQGILRFINSYKLNRLVQVVGLGRLAKRVKEGLGLGGGVVLLARKRG